MADLRTTLIPHPQELRQARFIRARPGDVIRSGVYLARRHGWPADQPWTVVAVEVVEDATGFWMAIWKFKSSEPEPWRLWRIGAPLVGLDKVGLDDMNVDPIEDAMTVP